VHIVAISSELYARHDEEGIAAQRAWLEADLAATDRPWTIVFLHRPPYSSTGSKRSDAIQADLAPLFAEAGVDLVLAGHAHSYERTVPIDGVTYIVTGGGGASIRGVDASDISAAVAETHHFVRIDATPEALAITAIDRDGEAFDTAELRNP
jgi:hypothetical protein